jgi:hypothetical protein
LSGVVQKRESFIITQREMLSSLDKGASHQRFAKNDRKKSGSSVIELAKMFQTPNTVSQNMEFAELAR